MNLNEEHPVIGLPRRSAMARKSEVEVMEFCRRRCDAIERERLDPFRYGYRPCVWDVCDDLLVSGAKVTLDGVRLGRLGGELAAGKGAMAEGFDFVFVFALVFNIATGLVGRVMPQFQIFFVAAPLQVLLGLAVFALSLGSLVMVWANHYRDLIMLFSPITNPGR